MSTNTDTGLRTKCLHYARPGSPAAVKYRCGETGCYYITIAEPLTHHRAKPSGQIWPATPGNSTVARDWFLNRIAINLPVDNTSYSRK